VLNCFSQWGHSGRVSTLTIFILGILIPPLNNLSLHGKISEFTLACELFLLLSLLHSNNMKDSVILGKEIILNILRCIHLQKSHLFISNRFYSNITVNEGYTLTNFGITKKLNCLIKQYIMN
jgi:hypothetical protein